MSCHPERSEGSAAPDTEILSAAKDDKADLDRENSSESVGLLLNW